MASEHKLVSRAAREGRYRKKLTHCQAETNSGARCKRAAKVTFRREWEEKVFVFFWTKKEAFNHYCSQHADKTKVGERVDL